MINKKKINLCLSAPFVKKLIHVLFKNKFIFSTKEISNSDIVSCSSKYTKLINEFSTKLKVYNKNYNDKFVPTNFFEINKDFTNVPFWNDEIKKLSIGLFLPHPYLITPEQNSFTKKTWFKSEFYKEAHDCFHLEEITYTPENKIQEITKCRKIKLYFTSEQAEAMKRLIGCYRYFYNRTIFAIKNYDKDSRTSYYLIDCANDKSRINIDILKDHTIYDFYYLRSILKDNKPDWVKEINMNSHIIDLAIHEAVNRYKTNILVAVKNKHSFDMKYKSKKDLTHNISFEKEMIHINGLLPNYKINGKYIFRNIKMSEYIGNLNYLGSSLTYHRVLKTFTLNLNFKTMSVENKSNKVGANDLGIREFSVIYSDTKVCKIGINSANIILKKCKEIDIIESRMNRECYYVKDKVTKEHKEYNMNSKRRAQLKRAKHRKIQELKNLKKELHDQTINYICSNYSKIIIPPFETQKMASKLHSKTARSMYTLSFYEFTQKLKNKGKENNCTVIIKPEYYTSKTCTRCGNIKHDLKMTDEIYECNKCGLKIDRNFAGSRNIMLRNN